MNTENTYVVDNLINEVNKTLVLTNDYITKAIPLIKNLSEEFYQEPSQNTWKQLDNLFEALEWILYTTSQIDSIKSLDKVLKNYKIWNQYVKTVSNTHKIVRELEKALNNNENKTIGDILHNDVTLMFKDMNKELNLLI